MASNHALFKELVQAINPYLTDISACNTGAWIWTAVSNLPPLTEAGLISTLQHISDVPSCSEHPFLKGRGWGHAQLYYDRMLTINWTHNTHAGEKPYLLCIGLWNTRHGSSHSRVAELQLSTPPGKWEVIYITYPSLVYSSFCTDN